MTGKELIIYILLNNLEDKEVFKNGSFLDFLSEDQVAAKFDVGIAAVKVWYELEMIKGVKLGEHVYFPPNIEDPRKRSGT